MRSSSGRVAIGLALLSTWAGACLSEQDNSEAVSSVATEPQNVGPETESAQEIVHALRSQMARTIGQTYSQSGQLPAINIFESLNPIHEGAPRAIELMGLSQNAPNSLAAVELPARADGAFRLRDEPSGLFIDVALEGTNGALRENADGYAIYRSGYQNDGHVIHRATSKGTEDYVYFPQAVPTNPELRYRLKLSDGVAGLRLIQQSIEMLDAKGAPRLRMAKPYAIDGIGRQLAMNVAIEGCAYDSSTHLPWGRTPVNPGARECTIRLSWAADAKAPLLVDPIWTPTTDMQERRMNATSIVADILGMARVLVVGGDAGTGASAASKTTEIYDPDSNSWTMGPMLNTPRTDHTMVVLGQTPHVIGGRNANGLLNTSEKLLPGPGGLVWQTATGNMVTARARPAVMAFEGNTRIFVAGGYAMNEAPLQSIEIYDSAVGWATPPVQPLMKMARAGHAIVRVPLTSQPPAGATLGLSVLLIGGKSDGGATPKSERCFAYLPVNQGPPVLECKMDIMVGMSNQAIPYMVKPRMNHVAVYDESTQKVHVFGGDGLNTAEVYDPMTADAWVETVNSPMQSQRSFFTVNPLQPNSSKYLVVGGIDTTQSSMPLATVDIYDAKAAKFTPTESLTTPRGRHNTVILPDSRPLVIGGNFATNIGTAEFMTCTSHDDCAPYNGGKSYCSKEGTCVAQKMPGVECNAKADCLGGMECAVCATGVCSFDGVCCDKACDGICESCKEPGQDGMCVAVPKGPPRPNHGECKSADPTPDDMNCNGKCDGVTRDSCEFPEGKSCGNVCTDDTDMVAPLGPSINAELVCNTEGRCIRGQVSTTCGPYLCADDKLSCRIECDDSKQCFAGNVCSNKQCIPGQTACGNADGLENNVVISTIPGKEDVRCEPYRCEAGACKNVCETAYDCLPKWDEQTMKLVNHACDENRTCVPIEETITDGDEASCAMAPAQESSRFGWLAAVALAGFVAARRNRARA